MFRLSPPIASFTSFASDCLLSADGALKLTDFGFACNLGSATLEEQVKRVGSPNYLSPELVTGAVRDADYSLTCADVYGIGCILYVMCAGALPFYHENNEVLYQLIAAGRWKMPPHFSSELQDLLNHLMEADWRRRYTLRQAKAHPFLRGIPPLFRVGSLLFSCVVQSDPPPSPLLVFNQRHRYSRPQLCHRRGQSISARGH